MFFSIEKSIRFVEHTSFIHLIILWSHLSPLMYLTGYQQGTLISWIEWKNQKRRNNKQSSRRGISTVQLHSLSIFFIRNAQNQQMLLIAARFRLITAFAGYAKTVSLTLAIMLFRLLHRSGAMQIGSEEKTSRDNNAAVAQAFDFRMLSYHK